jgi:hypothetical protein
MSLKKTKGVQTVHFWMYILFTKNFFNTYFTKLIFRG